MPDLREELGRLADFVGEPVGLPELASARRRRERRRRNAGLVAGLASVLLIAGIAFAVLRDGATTSTPGGPSPSAAVGQSCVPPSRRIPVIAENMTLAGCNQWPAETSLEIVLLNREQDIPVGLALFPAWKCSADGCTGKALLKLGTIVGPGSSRGVISSLAVGQYVVIDPKHAVTGRMTIAVSEAGPAPSISPEPTPSSQASDGPALDLPSTIIHRPYPADCPSGRATDVTIVEENLQLSGCGLWRSGEPITLTFDQRDVGTMEGLALHPCGVTICFKRTTWDLSLRSGAGTSSHVIGPLKPGGYVLIDPVHPGSAAMLIDVR